MNKKLKLIFCVWIILLILIILILLLWLLPVILNFILYFFIEGLTGDWLPQPSSNSDITYNTLNLNNIISILLIPEVILSIILLINRLKLINKHTRNGVKK